MSEPQFTPIADVAGLIAAGAEEADREVGPLLARLDENRPMLGAALSEPTEGWSWLASQGAHVRES